MQKRCRRWGLSLGPGLNPSQEQITVDVLETVWEEEQWWWEDDEVGATRKEEEVPGCGGGWLVRKMQRRGFDDSVWRPLKGAAKSQRFNWKAWKGSKKLKPGRIKYEIIWLCHQVVKDTKTGCWFIMKTLENIEIFFFCQNYKKCFSIFTQLIQYYLWINTCEKLNNDGFFFCWCLKKIILSWKSLHSEYSCCQSSQLLFLSLIYFISLEKIIIIYFILFSLFLFIQLTHKLMTKY